MLQNSEVKTEFEKFEMQQYSDVLTVEEITEAYETYKTKRDAVHEFEVEIAEEQVEKMVSEGLFIKVWMGIGQEGLIFIPNHQLNILEQKIINSIRCLFEKHLLILFIIKMTQKRIDL